MRSYRISQSEVSVCMNTANAIWLISQLTILAEHYTLAEEKEQAGKCQTLAAEVKKSINRCPKWCLDHDE
jgi:hypothetical protein